MHFSVEPNRLVIQLVEETLNVKNFTQISMVITNVIIILSLLPKNVLPLKLWSKPSPVKSQVYHLQYIAPKK